MVSDFGIDTLNFWDLALSYFPQDTLNRSIRPGTRPIVHDHTGLCALFVGFNNPICSRTANLIRTCRTKVGDEATGRRPAAKVLSSATNL